MLLGSAAGLAAMAVPGRATAVKASARRPNVVWIITDDQMRSTLRHMPRVSKRLVGTGIRFKSGYAAVPLCGPARASMLSGLFPHNHGCLSNDTHRPFVDGGHDKDTVATRMKAAGYDTGYFGKYMNGMEDDQTYVAPGWDRWVNRVTDHAFCVDGVMKTVEHVDRFSAAQCRAFIETRAGSPWFAVFAPRNPHKSDKFGPSPAHAHDFDGVQWDPPAFNEEDLSDKPSHMHELPFQRRSEMRSEWERKLEELQDTDDQIEQLLDTLAATNQLRRTFVFFVSDNGYMLGEHRIDGKGKAYEESAGIPFVVIGPGVSSGKRSALVSQVDLMPTTLAMAGANPDVGRAIDGRSMLEPLRSGDWSGWRRRLLVEHPAEGWAMLREGSVSFIDHHQIGEQELYDVAIDPHQLRSTARDTDTTALTDRLKAMRTATGMGLRELEAAP
ncbi:MAG: sulfatase-like hydrolase/transferase [Nocardioidaceae bacterium]